LSSDITSYNEANIKRCVIYTRQQM